VPDKKLPALSSSEVTRVIKINEIDFDGPYSTPSSLLHKPGIYVILDATISKSVVVDVGESGDSVRTRVENHDRRECWKSSSRGTLQVAVLYTPGMSDAQRRGVESAIRALYRPPCGVH